jgi:DNA-directed RNA polymerase specialized sigma24 family protein
MHRIGGDPVTDKIAAFKRDKNHDALILIYEKFRQEPLRYEIAFWTEVTKFARRKLKYLEMGETGLGSMDSDGSGIEDFAQEVVIGVLKGMPTFRGTCRSFPAFVHSICYKQAARHFNALKDRKDDIVSMMVSADGGLGDALDDEKGGKEVENPEIYKSNDTHEFSFSIPSSVQGVELTICKLMIDGMTTQGIAVMLKMTHAAIEKRLSRMRIRLADEKKTQNELAQQDERLSAGIRVPMRTNRPKSPATECVVADELSSQMEEVIQ